MSKNANKLWISDQFIDEKSNLCQSDITLCPPRLTALWRSKLRSALLSLKSASAGDLIKLLAHLYGSFIGGLSERWRQCQGRLFLAISEICSVGAWIFLFLAELEMKRFRLQLILEKSLSFQSWSSSGHRRPTNQALPWRWNFKDKLSKFFYRRFLWPQLFWPFRVRGAIDQWSVDEFFGKNVILISLYWSKSSKWLKRIFTLKPKPSRCMPSPSRSLEDTNRYKWSFLIAFNWPDEPGAYLHGFGTKSPPSLSYGSPLPTGDAHYLSSECGWCSCSRWSLKSHIWALEWPSSR